MGGGDGILLVGCHLLVIAQLNSYHISLTIDPAMSLNYIAFA